MFEEWYKDAGCHVCQVLSRIVFARESLRIP